MSAPTSDFQRRYGPWALVAGASEGMGANFGLQLAQRGLNLLLLARREDALRKTADDIRAGTKAEVRILATDLADPASVERVREAAAGLEIGLLVYNAAVASGGPFFDTPIEQLVAQQEVNCRRPLELCHLLGRPMIERGRGGIILLSSLAGMQGSPGLAHYGATKAWSRIFGEGLWGELRTQGVDVLACSAGATRTPGYLSHRPTDGGSVPEMEPSDVVTEALAALGRKPHLVPGRTNRVAAFVLGRLLPRRTAVSIMGAASARAADTTHPSA